MKKRKIVSRASERKVWRLLKTYDCNMCPSYDRDKPFCDKGCVKVLLLLQQKRWEAYANIDTKDILKRWV